MNDFNKRIAEISELNRIAKPSDAEEMMSGLIEQLSAEVLKERRERLLEVINGFFPKRRYRLVRLLEQRLERCHSNEVGFEIKSDPPPESDARTQIDSGN